MNRLEIAFINVFSPYKVWNRGEVLYFETDKGCRYAIDFEIEEHPLFQAYWFNKAGQQERYYFRTVEIKGEEPGTKEYVAIIIPRNHPKAEEILVVFDKETGMFNAMKP